MTKKELKNIRLKCGLTQKKMGPLMGMLSQHYSTIERETSVRKVTKVQAACARLIEFIFEENKLKKYLER